MKKRNQYKKRIILGVTGSFGAGKSTLAGIFGLLGAQVIDADKIAHRAIKPQTKVYSKIINAFGRGIVNKDKTINRDKLGGLVFDNNGLLEKLNRLIHPEVIKAVKQKIKSSKKKFIIIDAPLLIEAGLHKAADKLIVVKTNRQAQIKRLQDKLSLSRNEILKRISRQAPLREKLRIADFVIDNSGTIKETKKQAVAIWRCL